MTDHHSIPPTDPPIAGAPTWVRILQAAIIGLVAGLALHALLSMVVLQGKGLSDKRSTPTQCKKSNPNREAGTPAKSAPRISRVMWKIEGQPELVNW